MSQNQFNEGNPYAPGAAVNTSSAINPQQTYNGIRRLPYFGYGFLASLVYNVLVLAIGGMMGGGAAALAVLFLALLSLVVQLMLISLRLKNMGYSPWWCLGIIVPFLNLLIALRCLACPEGYAHHKTLDTPAKVIVGIFLSFIVLGVVAIVLAGSL